MERTHLIIGAGAMGTWVAQALKRSGREVLGLATHARAWRGVEGANIVTTPQGLGPFECAWFCAPAWVLEEPEFVSSLKVLNASRGVALSNGYGVFDLLSEGSPFEWFRGGVLTGLRFDADGSLLEATGGLGVQVLERTQDKALWEPLVQGGVSLSRVRAPEGAHPERWLERQKALMNAALNGVATLSQLTNGELLRPSGARDLSHQVLRELCVGEAETKAQIARFESVLSATSTNRNSMWEALTRGQKTEVRWLNGSLAQEIERGGGQAPLNRFIEGWIRLLENSVEKPDAPG